MWHFLYQRVHCTQCTQRSAKCTACTVHWAHSLNALSAPSALSPPSAPSAQKVHSVRALSTLRVGRGMVHPVRSVRGGGGGTQCTQCMGWGGDPVHLVQGGGGKLSHRHHSQKKGELEPTANFPQIFSSRKPLFKKVQVWNWNCLGIHSFGNWSDLLRNQKLFSTATLFLNHENPFSLGKIRRSRVLKWTIFDQDWKKTGLGTTRKLRLKKKNKPLKRLRIDKDLLRIQMKFYWDSKMIPKKKLGIRMKIYWIQIKILKKTVEF